MKVTHWFALLAGLIIIFNSASAAPPGALAQSRHWAISQGMTSHTVTDLLQDSHGFLWIATRNGLQRFDGVAFEHFMTGRQPHQLPSNNILDLWFTDNQLWVSTARGVAYFDYQQNRFYRHPKFDNVEGPQPPIVNKIVADFNGNLMFLSESRLWRVDTKTATPVTLSYNGDTLTNITNIHKGKRWIWLSEQDGSLYVWDGNSFDVFKVSQQNPITDPLPATGFNHILQRDDRIYFAHNEGLFILDDNFRLLQQLKNAKDLNNHAPINSLAYVDNGHLLLGTSQGIEILETSSHQPVYISRQHSLSLPPLLQVNALTVDHLQRLWVGAGNGGLYQFSKPRSALNFEKLLDVKLSNELNTLSLPSTLNDYTSATKDYEGFWWFTTELGLLKYELEQQQIKEVHPLPLPQPPNVIQTELFAEHLFMVDQKHGLLIFDIAAKQWQQMPKSQAFFEQENLRMAVDGSKIWIADKHNAVAIDEFFNVIEQVSLSQANSNDELKPLYVTTEFEQQTLYLDFVSPLAPEPERMHYRFRLFDLMDEWQHMSRPLQPISFNHLPAGSFSLQIQASVDGNDWAIQHRQTITVTGPWWKSIWAYGLYSLLLAGVLLFVGRWLLQLYRQRDQLVERHQDLSLAVESSGAQLWDWHIDEGELIRHNIWRHCPAFPIDGIRCGYEGSAANIHPQDLKRVKEEFSAIASGSKDTFECSYRLDNQGQWLWIMDRGKVTDSDEQGRPCRVQGAITDISGMINSEERLNMLALSLTNISDGICIFDRFFRKREINKAFETITGYSREQILEQPFTLQAYEQNFIDQIKRDVFKEGSWRGEVTDIRADGSEFQMELTLDTVTNDNGDIELIVASFSDVTERRNTENELRRLSNTDSLTGLPNRSYFQVSHSNLVRKKVPHALLIFDLDDFKKINDSLGHEVGDELLCRVAERLTDIGRRQDTLYRLGGDEFGLLVEDTTEINAISVLASKINTEIAVPFNIQQHEVVIGSSIGIVLYPHDGHTSQELLQKADTAMYHAKQRGGNCYQFFSQSMNENAIRRLQIENELRSAIREQRVEVFYQPKIELASQHIAGIEALARIRREDGTVISPADFIPLAEETGLIVPLSEQVLRQSCRDMKTFLKLAGAPRHVAINLSARQFSTSSLAFQIESILAEENMHPRHIEFEITEGMVMADPERAITMLENLADMGVQLALDDFGTGYSSLAYLKRFPLHTLKIDKAFVDDITTDDKDRNMVASIVGMAHNLGLKVVAEGVESRTQLEILKTLRCEYIQGFYYAEPMQADAFIRYIGQHQEQPSL